MILTVESSTSSRIYEILDIREMQKWLKIAMEDMKCEKCNFELKGEAGIKRVVELDCLFG
jgi:uncharacterized protein with PIN domain